MKKWCIFMYSPYYDTIIVYAENFDKALDQARKVNKHFVGGYIAE